MCIRDRKEGEEFNRIFLPWHADPRRSQQWYRKTRKLLGEKTLREYPASPEEAMAVSYTHLCVADVCAAGAHPDQGIPAGYSQLSKSAAHFFMRCVGGCGSRLWLWRKLHVLKAGPGGDAARLDL